MVKGGGGEIREQCPCHTEALNDPHSAEGYQLGWVAKTEKTKLLIKSFDFNLSVQSFVFLSQT